MSRKSKKEPEEMLEAPAAEQPPTETPVRLDWPEATEVRPLDTDLNDDQIVTKARELVDSIRKVEALADQKKANAEHFKALIEDEEKRKDELQNIVKSGKDRTDTICRWHFQTNGINELGELLFHSELKTLVREDTGAVVEIKPITADDRQLHLQLGEVESLDSLIQQLADAGFEVVETPGEPGDDEAPFLMVGLNGCSPIQADSMASALRLAVAELALMQDNADAAQGSDAADDEDSDHIGNTVEADDEDFPAED